MKQPRKIVILGSTGSIGRQTLDIISHHPDLFSPAVLIAGNNAELLAQQALTYHPQKVIIANEGKYNLLKSLVTDTSIEVEAGDRAVLDAMTIPDVEMIVTSTVGYSGLLPTLKAIEGGKDIALANKETLVVAGELVMKKAREKGIKIYPVDSEHSAIYQCLQGEDVSKIRNLIITASGGPFRTLPVSELEKVTVDDALRHPNWSMGAKITVDSATMMNKAFEIIEATWLFNVPAGQIKALVHPQSIIHSMVEFADGSIKAQLGVPDMRLPIKYALFRGQRINAEVPSEFLTLSMMSSLSFEEPDLDKFPCLGLAQLSIHRGGNTACVINAANEIAVKAFLNNRIKFTDINKIITRTLEKSQFVNEPTLEDYIHSNSEAREYASQLIN